MAQNPNEYHLVTFDPGGTIGWAHFVLSIRAFSRPQHKVLRFVKSWECGEFEGSEFEQCQSASRLIWSARFGTMPYNSATDVVSTGISRGDIVSEDFELTQLIGGRNLLSPVRINAVLGYECDRWGLKLELQHRTLRKNVTPERLVEFGFASPLNRGGKWSTTSAGKDAFAAMQHAIVWLRRVKEISRSKPWKLNDGQTSNAYWDCRCRNGAAACDFRHPK
jgi:hypothetical protein